MREVTTMRKELLKGLTEEQIKKVEACKNSDEILLRLKELNLLMSSLRLFQVADALSPLNVINVVLRK